MSLFRHGHAAAQRASEKGWLAPLLRAPIPLGSSACCCPARASYAVVLPPTVSMPAPPELLLCTHHARASFPRLQATGGALYDACGRLVERDRQRVAA